MSTPKGPHEWFGEHSERQVKAGIAVKLVTGDMVFSVTVTYVGNANFGGVSQKSFHGAVRS